MTVICEVERCSSYRQKLLGKCNDGKYVLELQLLCFDLCLNLHALTFRLAWILGYRSLGLCVLLDLLLLKTASFMKALLSSENCYLHLIFPLRSHGKVFTVNDR